MNKMDVHRRKVIERYLEAVERRRKFNETVDRETASVCDGARKQWGELNETIEGLENLEVDLRKAMEIGKGSIEEETAELRAIMTRVAILRPFKAQFERRWHLDAKGSPLPETKWELSTGQNFYRKLRQRISSELRMAEKIESELQELNGVQRELRLMELHRCE